MEIIKIKGVEWIKLDDILAAIRDAPNIDYVGEHLIKLIKNSPNHREVKT